MLLLEWLSSGVLQQQHFQHHHMPYSSAASVASNGALSHAVATAAPAAAVAYTPEVTSVWSESLQLFNGLVHLLLPRQPNGLLLLLYGFGRDAVCVGSNTLSLLLLAVLPVLFSFVAVVFFLPS